MEERIIELALQGMGARKIAKELGIGVTTAGNYLRKNSIRQRECSTVTEELIIKRFKNKCEGFEYVKGYIGCDKNIIIRCKICGCEFEHVAGILRPGRRNVNIQCPECAKNRRIANLIIKKQLQQTKSSELTEQRKLIKELKAKLKEDSKPIFKHICNECGKEYKNTRRSSMFCNTECGKKYNNRKKTLRKRVKAISNGKVEYGINLTKLIKKDNNTCYICGGKCNSNDYKLDDKGYFIAGGTYPSVDHVLPIAKGGTHSWDNVRLAHCLCNSLKSDKLNYKCING